MWATMFDFVSAEPRPKRAPSRSVSSYGGDAHSSSGPAGDDVVVAVEQNRRRAGRGGDLADDHRCRVRELENRDVDAHVTEQRGDRVVRLEECRPRLFRESHRGDRRNRDEIREIGAQLWHQLRDGGGDRPALRGVAAGIRTHVCLLEMLPWLHTCPKAAETDFPED